MASLSLNYAQVLHEAGVDVKSVPAKIPCPICGDPGLLVHPDNGSYWMFCRGCEFTGDPLALHAQVNNNDLRTSLAQLTELGAVVNEVSDDDLAEYFKTVEDPRRFYTSFLTAAHSTLRNGIGSRYGDLLQQYGMYTGGVGTTDSYQLRRLGALPGHLSLADLKMFPRPGEASRRFRTAILLPAYTLPGKLSGATFFSQAGSQTRTIGDDAGFGLLDTVNPGEPVAWAFSNALIAIRAQLNSVELTGKELPLVVFSKGTTDSWETLPAAKVILWSPDFDVVDVIGQAMRAGNGWVVNPKNVPTYNIPVDGAATTNFFKQVDPETLLQSLELQARHWADTLRDHLLNNMTDAVSTIARLPFQAHHMSKLEEACRPADWEKLSPLFKDRICVYHELEIDNKVFFECEDGYWSAPVANREKRTRVTNFTMNIEKAVRLRKANSTFYQGTVSIQGMVVPFFEASDVISNPSAFGQWVDGGLLDEGMNVLPVIAKSWRTKLVDVIKLMRPPEVTMACEEVVWEGDSIYFPRFQVNDGVLTALRNNVIGEDAPFSNVTLPLFQKKSDFTDLMFVNRQGAQLLQLAAFMASVFTAERAGWDAPSAVVVGGEKVISTLIKNKVLECCEEEDSRSAFPRVVTEYEQKANGLLMSLDEVHCNAACMDKDLHVIRVTDDNLSAKEARVFETFLVKFVLWLATRLPEGEWEDSNAVDVSWQLLSEYVDVEFNAKLPKSGLKGIEKDADKDYWRIAQDLSEIVEFGYGALFDSDTNLLYPKLQKVLTEFGLHNDEMLRIARRIKLSDPDPD